MAGLLVGFDLCDVYSHICVVNHEANRLEDIFYDDTNHNLMMPTAICKCRGIDQWKIGQDALESALSNTGIIVDKLLRLVSQEGTSTLEGVCYRADELLVLYVQYALEKILQLQNEEDYIEQIVFTLRKLDIPIMDAIMQCMENMKIKSNNVRIISHTESFMFYLLSQKPEVYANTATLFDLSDDSMMYYECKISRGMNPQICQVTKEKLEDNFNLRILEEPSGKRMADSIMFGCANRLLEKKIVSSVCLSGKGFENVSEWDGRFLKYICNRRKVYYEPLLFVKGAALLAVDRTRSRSAYPYICVCEGRIGSTISMEVIAKAVPQKITLVKAGDNWYSAQTTLDFIIDGEDALTLEVTPIGQKKGKMIRIPFDQFPPRPNKTTRVSLKMIFENEDVLRLEIKDLGFGSMFPSSGITIMRELKLNG